MATLLMLSMRSPVSMLAFSAGEPGSAFNYRNVSVTLGEDETDASLRIVGAFFILAILIGIQVAGERIDRLQKAVDSAESDTFHVGLFDIFELDTFENFGVDLQMSVDIVVRDSAAASCTE